MIPCEANLKGCQKVATHDHHRKLRSQGGTHGPTLPCCLWCHTQIHNFPARAYASGLLIHAWDDDAPLHPELFDLESD